MRVNLSAKSIHLYLLESWVNPTNEMSVVVIKLIEEPIMRVLFR